MGNLALALSNGPDVKKGPPCTVGLWLAALDAETRSEAEALMRSTEWQHTALSAAFKDAGGVFAASTISRHRKGECKNCG